MKNKQQIPHFQNIIEKCVEKCKIDIHNTLIHDTLSTLIHDTRNTLIQDHSVCGLAPEKMDLLTHMATRSVPKIIYIYIVCLVI
jgi:hypothetical protein